MDTNINETNQQSQIETEIPEEIVEKVKGIEVKKYKRGNFLGKGGFARCYELIDVQTQCSWAGKIISKSKLIKSRAKQKLINEIKIHNSVHHENIVQFGHYFEDSEYVYVLIEYCTNQNLNKLIKRRKRLTELEAQCYLLQIIKALKYLHSNKIIHRDLKLSNIFLTDDMKAKLGDFGLAIKLSFDGEKRRSFCGTPNYIAPEILEGKIGHSYEVDIWSLGIVLYIFLIGKPPFETTDIHRTYKLIRTLNYSFPHNIRISQPAKSLIQSLLVLQPKKRLSLDEILKSEFMNMGVKIPTSMPLSTLTKPPDYTYMKDFIPNFDYDGVLTKYRSKNPNKKFISEDLGSQVIPVQSSVGNVSKKYQGKKNISFDMNSNDNNYQEMNYEIGNIPEIFIMKWADSEKNGLAYVLSNGNVGINCIDDSKLIYKPHGENFIYIDKSNKAFNYFINSQLNSELKEKFNLLESSKCFLFGESNENKKIYDNVRINDRDLLYLKRFIKTKHAFLFRLSNKTVQVCFHDNTELIIGQVTQNITYINKIGQKLLYHLYNAFDVNNKEMIKRLKYTKKLLIQMLLSSQGQ